MTERTLKRLVGGLLGLAALYLIVVAARYLTRPRAAGGGALGLMIARIHTDTIERVRITIPPGDTVVLRRGQGGGLGSWTVNGLQVDTGRVDVLLQGIAEAQVGGLVSQNPATLDRLGVSDTLAWRVELDGTRDTARFYIATEGSDAGNGYARLPSETKVYEVSAKLRAVLTNPVGDWRNKEIVRVDTAAVDRIEIGREGASVELQRSSGGWVMEPGGGAKPDPSRVAMILVGADPLRAMGFPPDTTKFSGKESRALRMMGARGNTLAAFDFVGSGQHWLARVAGAPPLYQISREMVDRLTPKQDDLQPPRPKKR